MGRMKELWQEQQDDAEPCPSDFKTKKEYNEFMKVYKPKKPTRLEKRMKAEKQAWMSTFNSSYRSGNGEPMSINAPFDNADAWLDDEPWRKW